MYDAPTREVRIAGRHLRFTAGLDAFMAIHEHIGQNPSAWQPVRDPDTGDIVAHRLQKSRANSVRYFHAFCVEALDDQPLPTVADWERIVDSVHPLDVMSAWAVCDDLLDEAGANWDQEADDGTSFRA